ncbi:hypothetical protein KCU74_g4445, partial [Aureobasidium melanogenum]
MSDLDSAQDTNMTESSSEAHLAQQADESSSMADQKHNTKPLTAAEASSSLTEQQQQSKPLSRGHSIEGLVKPGQFEDGPAFPGINLNENMELAFKNIFLAMLDHHEKGQSEAAEALAYELITWGKLPVLYRVYSHVILAHGPIERLFHACKAVEQAQWGIKKYGDEKGVGTRLLAIADATLREVRAEAAAAMNEGGEEEMDVGKEEEGGEQQTQGMDIDEVSDTAMSQQDKKVDTGQSHVNEAEPAITQPATSEAKDEAAAAMNSNAKEEEDIGGEESVGDMAIDEVSDPAMSQGEEKGVDTEQSQDDMLLSGTYSGIMAPPSLPPGTAKVDFASQQTSISSGDPHLTRTASSVSNITRTSSSSTAPSRTASSTTGYSRTTSNTTNITDYTDFASQSDDGHNTGAQQKGDDTAAEQEGGEGADTDSKKREKRGRSGGSSEEEEQPPKKKTDLE